MGTTVTWKQSNPGPKLQSRVQEAQVLPTDRIFMQGRGHGVEVGAAAQVEAVAVARKQLVRIAKLLDTERRRPRMVIRLRDIEAIARRAIGAIVPTPEVAPKATARNKALRVVLCATNIGESRMPRCRQQINWSTCITFCFSGVFHQPSNKKELISSSLSCLL